MTHDFLIVTGRSRPTIHFRSDTTVGAMLKKSLENKKCDKKGQIIKMDIFKSLKHMDHCTEALYRP